jgi:hypothetical protein
MASKKTRNPMVKPLVKTEVAAVEDLSGQQVAAAWLKAGIVGVAAVAMAVFLPMKWVLDMNSPDFNPMVLMVLALGVFALVSAGQALWVSRRHRRFGSSELKLEGDGVGRMGRMLKGWVKTARPLTGAEVARVTLSYVESHAFRNLDASDAGMTHSHAFVVWDRAMEVPLAGVDCAGAGIPFQFAMPESVGKKPQQRAPENPYFKFKGVLKIPGMKARGWAHGVEPEAREWRLEVRAETAEGVFKTAFRVPVEG